MLPGNDNKKGDRAMPENSENQSASTLLPMLLWGLFLIVVGAAGVMMFV